MTTVLTERVQALDTQQRQIDEQLYWIEGQQQEAAGAVAGGDGAAVARLVQVQSQQAALREMQTAARQALAEV